MRQLSLGLVVSLAVVGCARPATVAPSPAPPATFDVQVDAKTADFNLATSAYFPAALRAHPGDTVRFTRVDTGNPHTVTFGSLIEDFLTDLAKLPAEIATQPEPEPQVEALIAAKGLPELIAGVPPQRFVAGAAGQPCVLATGMPPTKDACTADQQAGASLTGTQRFFNSGYLGQGAVFTVKLDPAIAPGAYHFLCLHHFGSMVGTLTVVAPSEQIPAPDAVKAEGAKRLAHVVQALTARLAAVGSPSPDKALAGVTSPDAPEALAAVFVPKQAVIPVGGSVTWAITERHVIAFNASQDAVGVIAKGPDGVARFNPKAVMPVNGPPVPQPASGRPSLFDSGAWDGRGVRSSGIIVEALGLPIAYRLTFTQPGTYPYKCLIHPDMEGTIKVGN